MKSEIVLVAPSGDHAARFPTRRRAAIADIEEHGVAVTASSAVEARLARRADAPDRVAELNEAFARRPAPLVMATIGGETGMDLLNSLDFPGLAKTGAILCGYSDITVIQLAGQRAGLTSLMGPMLMTQFGDRNSCDPFTWDHFDRAVRFIDGEIDLLVLEVPEYRLSPHEAWGGPREGMRTRRPCSGPVVVHEGAAVGPLLTANIASLDAVLGTPYQPSLDGVILGIEAAEIQSPYELRRLLYRLSALGLTKRLAALLVGRLTENGSIGAEPLVQIVSDLDLTRVPVVLELPFGHVDPIVSVPLGMVAELEVLQNRVTLILRR